MQPVVIGNRHPNIVPESADRNGPGQFFAEDVSLESGTYAARVIVVFSELWRGESITVRAEGLTAEGSVVLGSTEIERGGDDGNMGYLAFTVPAGLATGVRLAGVTTGNCASTALRLITIVATTGENWSKTEFYWPTDALPRISEIETVFITPCGKCNASCIHCPVNKDDRAPQHGLMSMELYRKIIDDLANGGFRGVVLFSPFAESFADPMLPERVKYLRRMIPNCSIWVATNGALFNKNKHAEMLEYLDILAIHVMSGTPETYDSIMTPLKASKVFAKIDEIVDACATNNSLNVELNCPVHRDNVEELGLLTERFPVNKGFQHNFFSFSGRCTETGVFPRLSLAPIGSVCQPTILQHFLVVDWDGAVIPCTDDFYRSNVLGNLTTQTIEEVYNSRAWGAVREKFRRSEYHRLGSCANCRKDASFQMKPAIHRALVKDHPEEAFYTARAFRTQRYALRDERHIFIPASRDDYETVIWGPYVYLPKGRYRVSHRIETTEGRLPEGNIHLDVSLGYGVRTTAMTDLEPVTGIADYGLEFDHDSLEVTEFRVGRPGGLALRHHGATLMRLA